MNVQKRAEPLKTLLYLKKLSMIEGMPEPPPIAARIQPGSRATIALIDADSSREVLKVRLVPDEQADFANGLLGTGSLLGRTLANRGAGERIRYPQGGLAAIEILAVEPPTADDAPAAANPRQEMLRQVVEESNRTNAILFASSFNGKWGDYDPSSLLEDPEKGGDARSKPSS